VLQLCLKLWEFLSLAVVALADSSSDHVNRRFDGAWACWEAAIAGVDALARK
jgi:hypothetical protein